MNWNLFPESLYDKSLESQMYRIKFNSDEGDIIFCGSEAEPVVLNSIRLMSIESRYLCLTTEDEVIYDFGVVVGECSDYSQLQSFISIGGYFGVSIPSGKLIVTSSKEWDIGKHAHEIDVIPGEYIAEVKTQEFEYLEYRKRLIEMVGIKEVEHQEMVDKLGLWAWLPTVFF